MSRQLEGAALYHQQLADQRDEIIAALADMGVNHAEIAKAAGLARVTVTVRLRRNRLRDAASTG